MGEREVERKRRREREIANKKIYRERGGKREREEEREKSIEEER